MHQRLRLAEIGTFPLPAQAPFTAQQALQNGVSRHELRSLEKRHLIRRMMRGVYVAADLPDSPELRAQALAAVLPPGVVITDEYAGWLHGASMILPPGSHKITPAVTAFGANGKRRVRNPLSISGTRGLQARDVVAIHGLVVTTPLRTATDLLRLRHADRALACFDQLLRLDVFGVDDVLRELERFRGFRGIRQARWLAPFGDARSESPGESIVRLRCLQADVPIPELQVDIFDREGNFIGRCDLVYVELKLIIEYDGEEWHGPDRAAHDEARRQALRDAGWEVVVLRRHNLFGPKADAIEIIRAAVTRAQRRFNLG